MPDREERFRVMLDMVEALVGPRAPGAGPRVRHGKYLRPAARSGSPRPTVSASTSIPRCWPSPRALRGRRPGHLRDAPTSRTREWTAKLPHDSYDAVLTATALHWLHTEDLSRRSTGSSAALVRDGGVFMNADHMPDETHPADQRRRARPPARAHGPGQGGRRRRLGRVVAAGRRGPACSPRRPPSASRSTASTRTATPRRPRGTRAVAARRGLRARPGRCGARPRTRWCSGLK